jgi:ectoine hydroxylase-related dioxygenase (phytanoyl-CoA dioxygenase family)
VHRLTGLPEVVDFLRLAYGREPFPFQTLNFEHGSQQHPHADSMHFHTIPERFMCGVWLALEDVAEDAGPLVYYPGSHRLPVLTMRDVGAGEPPPFAELYRDYARFYEPAVDRLVADHGLKPAYGLLKRGEALVWAANLLHGGAPIARPGATRRSLVTHYFFEDCLYFTPLRSDIEHGQLDVRLPTDVRTGRWRWPKRDGRPVWPGHRAILGALRQRVRRQPQVARLQG